MYASGEPQPFGKSVAAVFIGAASVTNLQWQAFLRPPGHTMLSALLMSGGGGAGAGFSAAAAAARGGGGSGGSSGQTALTIPWALLPERLYVQAGAGGLGVSTGSGGAGTLSYLGIHPNTSASNIVAVSGAAGPTGGGTGTGAAVGAAGAAGTIATIGAMPLGAAGQFTLLAGQAGVAGGAVAGAVGSAIAIPTTGLRCMAGSGGAGVTAADFAGGLMTAIADSWLSEQRPATPAAGSNPGSGGHPVWTDMGSLLFNFGGLGGSSSNAGVGGAGGNGAYGSGGGGGGGGTTGGRGGDGGPGVIVLVSW